MAEENSQGLCDAVATAERRRVESERECQEQFEEFTLLQTRGSKLCLAIIGPSRVRNHILMGMWITALCHTEMAGEPAALRVAVSSTMEFVLGRSPDETLRVEVVDELVADFQHLE
jgi:hypothetical protein